MNVWEKPATSSFRIQGGDGGSIFLGNTDAYPKKKLYIVTPEAIILIL
jgi:hypothetical protein